MPYTNGISPASLPAANLGMNTGSVGGAVAHSNVVENVYSVYDPFSILRLAFERHGKRPRFRQMLDMLGPDFNRGVNAPTTGHYERNNWVGQMVNIGTVETAAAGAGNAIVLNLTSDSMTTTGVEVSGSARKGSPVRVRDLILFPGNILGQVTAKTVSTDPHRITVTPLSSTVDLDDVVVASTTYAIVSNAHAPGSGLPEGLLPKTFKYTNKFQIVKEAIAISGTELTNETFVQVLPGANGSVFGVMSQDVMDRFEYATSGALLWGQENDNIVDTTTIIGYDVNVSWTEGFMQFRSGNSYEVDYDPAAFTLDEFDEISRILEQENGGTRTILSLQGNEYSYILQTALDDKFDGSLAPAMLQRSLAGSRGYGLSLDEWQPVIEQSDFIAWLGWQGIRRSGFEFYFRMMHDFVSVDGAGAAAYEYNYDAIYLPLTSVTDRTTGRQSGSIGYEWKELPPYSRKAVFGNLDGAGVAGMGGLSGTAVSEYDWRRAFMLSELAFHGACPNKIVYHTKEA